MYLIRSLDTLGIQKETIHSIFHMHSHNRNIVHQTPQCPDSSHLHRDLNQLQREDQESKAQRIFKDVKNSYTFWSIKKAIKDEIVKGRGKPSEIQEQIPRLLKELNLETKF